MQRDPYRITEKFRRETLDQIEISEINFFDDDDLDLKTNEQDIPIPEGNLRRVNTCERRPLNKSKLVACSGFNGHIILMGNTSGIAYFITHLRSVDWKVQIPIVILHPDFPESTWKEINFFPFIYYVAGNPTKILDLERVGVSHASRVIFLPENSRIHELQQDPDLGDFFADSETISTIRSIEHLSSKPFIITELLHSESMKFLKLKFRKQRNSISKLISNPTKKKKKNKWKVGKFGGSIVSRMLNLGGGESQDVYNSHPYFASGRVLLSSMMDSLLSYIYWTPELLHIISQLIFSKKFDHLDSEIQQSSVFLYKIPEIFNGKYFQQFFSTLAKQFGIICLGLYRSGKHFEEHSPLPYVFTNPPPDTLIYHEDSAYLLSSSLDLISDAMTQIQSQKISLEPFLINKKND
eukprot:Anaeramoba_ignava/a96095_29.p1 GENE.a96095_29~~a96095_29.p1  ORF type:complete len:409 (-),score=104.98 a96095_29:39-1265(-)